MLPQTSQLLCLRRMCCACLTYDWPTFACTAGHAWQLQGGFMSRPPALIADAPKEEASAMFRGIRASAVRTRAGGFPGSAAEGRRRFLAHGAPEDEDGLQALRGSGHQRLAQGPRARAPLPLHIGSAICRTLPWQPLVVTSQSSLGASAVCWYISYRLLSCLRFPAACTPPVVCGVFRRARSEIRSLLAWAPTHALPWVICMRRAHCGRCFRRPFKNMSRYSEAHCSDSNTRLQVALRLEHGLVLLSRSTH